MYGEQITTHILCTAITRAREKLKYIGVQRLMKIVFLVVGSRKQSKDGHLLESFFKNRRSAYINLVI